METVDLARMVRDNRRICTQVELYASGELAAQGVTAAQAHVLLQVLCHGERGTSLTAIHRELGYSMAHLSAILRCLREKGYVRMERCARDDRCKEIFATQRGEQLGEALSGSLRAVQRRLFACFSPAELGELDRLQRRMLQNLTGIFQGTKGGNDL